MGDSVNDLVWFEFDSTDKSNPGQISLTAVEPRRNELYIDSIVTAVAFGIYLKGFLVYCAGVDLPVFVPETMVDFGLGAVTEASNNIFDSADAARAAAVATKTSNTAVNYFWGAGGVVVCPTIICPATAPRTIATMRDAMSTLGEVVSNELVALAVSMIGTALLRMAYGRLVAVKRPKVTPPAHVVPPAAASEEITEATVRAAMKNAPLKSQQQSVSLPTIRKYTKMAQSGSKPPPIKVDNGIIVEGNHRYIAGRIAGKEPAVQPWLGGRPDRVVPWDKIKIDPVEW